MVQAMASYGVTQDDIAAVLEISDVTLRKYYSRELKIAAAIANSTVAQHLFTMATAKENTSAKASAAKFWLECRAGWRRASADVPDRDFAPEYIGKKAQQARDAATAGTGTEWGDDLTPPGLLN